MEQTQQRNRSLVGWLVILILFVYALAVVAYFVSRVAISEPPPWLALIHNGAPYYLALAVVGFILALLLRVSRLAAFYLLIIVVGAVWLGVRLSPSLEQAEMTGTPINIVTYNACPTQDVTATNEWLIGQAADLLFMQEVRTDFPALDDAYEASFLGEGGQQRIYSSFPILEDEPVRLENFVAQRIVIDVNGVEVAVYNVHFAWPLAGASSSDTFDRILAYDETTRNSQIRQFLAHIETESLPHIVAGDFNLSEWALIYDEIDAQLNDAYRAVSWGIGATWPRGFNEAQCGDSVPRFLRLDYVWYSDDFQAISSVVGPAIGSDHLPVKATLDLTATAQ